MLGTFPQGLTLDRFRADRLQTTSNAFYPTPGGESAGRRNRLY